MWLSNCVRALIFTCVLGSVTAGFAQTNTLPMISAIDATNYLNQQVVVVDKVVQLAFRSNIWLLHLNQKYPNSPLNGTIRKSYTNDFPNINDYLGQRVEITGRITQFRGRLEVALTSTNQIKIVGAEDLLPTPAPAIAQSQTKAVPVAPETNAVASATPAIAKEDNGASRALDWILGLLAVISVLLAIGVFMFWRRQLDVARALPPAIVPARLSQGTTAADAPSAEAWRERALAAEAMAGKQGEILREKMMPELTEFAKQSLVQGLYAQRNVLIETQRKAHLALSELESRLNAVQSPLHERIRAYEQRIAELEKEVETQGEEMRELTRATLVLVRKKLEDERRGEPTPRLQSRFN
jgi:hypothetical protein